MRLLQRRPSNPVERWEDGAYRKALSLGGGLGLAEVRQEGLREEPVLAVRLYGGSLSTQVVEGALSTLARTLGIAVDTEPFQQLAMSDPALASVARALRGLKPPRFASLLESLINVIAFQQISLTAALAIVGRLVTSLGSNVTWQGREYWAFPDAVRLAATGEEALRGLGFSSQKARALRAVAALVADGGLTLGELEALPSPAAAERLTALPGVGRWSADLILLRGLGRLDVFPAGDSGIRRGLARIFGLARPADAAQEAALVERFGALRGLLYLLVAGSNLMDAGILQQSD
ncbi:MAG: DNA-3-methyladenine glycosylase 2 family protein [Chloroflexi bacterium]|nr:DNA-3-methyladenine glycosylase 2 family protein [Chloroflexota bacterium]